MFVYKCSILQFPPVKLTSVNNQSSIRLNGLERMINVFCICKFSCSNPRIQHTATIPKYLFIPNRIDLRENEGLSKMAI